MKTETSTRLEKLFNSRGIAREMKLRLKNIDAPSNTVWMEHTKMRSQQNTSLWKKSS